MATGLIGVPPAGFLGRVTNLERDVSFLKQKVEDDARWKHLLENWLLDNFAFDLRGALLAKEKGVLEGYGSGGHRNRGSRMSRGSSSSNAKLILKKRDIKVKKSQTKNKSGSESDDDERGASGRGDEDGSDGNNLYSNEGMEVNVDPRDLIITPDSPSVAWGGESDGEEGDEVRGQPQFKNSNSDGSDSEYDAGGSPGSADGGGGDQVEEESSSEDEGKRKNKKMKWSLHSSYSSMESLKDSFNMRDWALWTTSKTKGCTKIYYYCKMCRKSGPGRLMLRFQSEDTDVEVFKNHLEHDHSRKNRLTDEIRSEIFNLYRAGMKNSTQIISSFKISKPDLRVPSPKQVCYVLKAHKKRERKERKLLGLEEDKKPKIKKLSPTKKLEKLESQQRALLLNSFVGAGNGGTVGGVPMDMSSITTGASHSEHFQQPHPQVSQSQVQHPQIVSVSGFNPAVTSAPGVFNSSAYHQGTYDPSNSNNSAPLHLQHQHFHSL